MTLAIHHGVHDNTVYLIKVTRHDKLCEVKSINYSIKKLYHICITCDSLNESKITKCDTKINGCLYLYVE